MIEIIGHRGYAAKAPENTLVSLERAIEAGADAVEFDVRVASCGTPVLMHDETLARTSNGMGGVARRSMEQLGLLDAGKWFSADFAGERIPSLAEALDAVSGRVRRVYCEVKGYGELDDVDRMVDIAREAGLLDAVVFISLDWRAVEHVADGSDSARIGYVLDDAARADEAVGRVERRERGFVDANAELLLGEPALCEMMLGAGVEVGVWTVNDPERATTLAGMGVTRFTTDEVESLVEWRSALS